MEHTPTHPYKPASPCCSPWWDQWPQSLTQPNLPRQNWHQAHLLQKPSRNCQRVVNQVLYFVFLCGNDLLHPKNTAVSPSMKEKENYKKIEQEVLKGVINQVSYFVFLCDHHLLDPKHTAVSTNRNYWRVINQVHTLSSWQSFAIYRIIAVPSSMKENHKIKQELVKNSKQGQYFVVSHDDHLLHPKHSHIFQWCTIEKTGRHVNIHVPFITLTVVLLSCLQLRTMPCKWLWLWRNILQQWYHTQKKELLVRESTSKRPWGLQMMGRHTTSFEWVLQAHTLISCSWL